MDFYSESGILERIPVELQDSHSLYLIPDPVEYAKTLGIEGDSNLDHFHLTIAKLSTADIVTK